MGEMRPDRSAVDNNSTVRVENQSHGHVHSRDGGTDFESGKHAGNIPCGTAGVSVAEKRERSGQHEVADDVRCRVSCLIKISLDIQQAIGVRIATVEMRAATYSVRTLGRVVPAENEVYRLIATTDGWMREVHGSTTGRLIQKDQLMATFYSTEFYGRQQQYLYALDYREHLGRKSDAGDSEAQLAYRDVRIQRAAGDPSESESPSPTFAFRRDQVELARQGLINLGVGEAQIEEITRTRGYAKNIEVRAPVTGFVLARNVFPHQWF